MGSQTKEIYKIENLEDYKKWISEQNWYQTIHLNNGLVTSGKLNTDSRISWFKEFNFAFLAVDQSKQCKSSNWFASKWLIKYEHIANFVNKRKR